MPLNLNCPKLTEFFVLPDVLPRLESFRYVPAFFRNELISFEFVAKSLTYLTLAIDELPADPSGLQSI